MMADRGARILVVFALGVVSACFPSFEDRPWLVKDVRIVAVRGTPAEAEPNALVIFDALIASPSGLSTAAISWAFCMSPRRVEERTGVTAACANGDQLQAITNPAAVLADACARFGPNPPPTSSGEPPLRPADPDPTGGYYLPVRAAITDPSTGNEVSAFGFHRIRCDLAGATRPVFEEYQDRYTQNVNPTIGRIVVIDDAGQEQDASAGPRVAAGTSVTIRVQPGDDAAEPYVVYDVANNLLRDRIEDLTVNWNVSAGELSRGRQTVAGDAEVRSLETTWTAPDAAGTSRMWVVLRDARGGSDWMSFDVTVD